MSTSKQYTVNKYMDPDGNADHWVPGLSVESCSPSEDTAKMKLPTPTRPLLLMMEILHYLKDPKLRELWYIFLKDPKLRELWYISYYGSCRIYTIKSRDPRSPVPKA